MKRLLPVLILLTIAVPAKADKPAPKAAVEPAPPEKTIDVTAIRDKMILLTDGKSHYVALVPKKWDKDTFFYGDGKRFYSVSLRGGGSQGDTQFSATFIDPRYYIQFSNRSDLEFRDGKYTVSCGERKAPFTLVAADEAKKILDAAVFVPSPRKFQAYALARDTRGAYYYVDQGRTPETAKNFRLFVGPKGNLKLQKMTNVVSDSQGEVFTTKSGSLRLVMSKQESTWIEREKPTKLTMVPVDDNVRMIYTELGIYTERLGTPCDDI